MELASLSPLQMPSLLALSLWLFCPILDAVIVVADADDQLTTMVTSDGLSLNMCQAYMEAADEDQSGGISLRNGEYAILLGIMGERKCSPQAQKRRSEGIVVPASGTQSIVFLNLVCGVIDTSECSYDAEIPVYSMETDMMQDVCSKVDNLIFSTCEPTPPTDFPTSAPDPPTPSPRPPSTRTITPGLTVGDCEAALNQANAQTKNILTFDEYVSFLNIMGQQVCFVPNPNNFPNASGGTYAQLKCMSNDSCENATNVNMNVFTSTDDLLYRFCALSYTLALNAPRCPTPASDSSNNNNNNNPPTPTAPVAPQPSLSPTQSAPPSISAGPSISPEPTSEVQRSSLSGASINRQVWWWTINNKNGNTLSTASTVFWVTFVLTVSGWLLLS